MTDKNREETQAFAQKMQEEGAAGFAAGLTPWDSWDDFEGRIGSRKVWQSTAKQVAGAKIPQRSFGDRILATMTVLAIATLVVGVAGVFLTQQPALQIAENNAQLSSSPAITAEIQLPPEEDIVFNDVSIPATPASPIADIITEISVTEIGMATGPSGDLSRDQDGSPVLPAILAEGDNLFTALDELPAPVAGTVYRPSTTPSEAAVEAVADEHAENPDINTAEAEINTPVQPAQLSRTNMPDVPAEVEQLPARDISENKQGVNNGGDWSINIASYLRDSTAEKMQQRFLDKGVATDLVTASVRGKTYYRLRVTGFESRKAAMAQSTGIREKLGLDEVWITKK